MAKGSLNETIVRNMKLDYVAGSKVNQISAKYKVPRPTVYAVLQGKFWEEVSVEGFQYKPKPNCGKRISNEKKSQLLSELRHSGNVNVKDIASTYNISSATVYKLLKEVKNVA